MTFKTFKETNGDTIAVQGGAYAEKRILIQAIESRRFASSVILVTPDTARQIAAELIRLADEVSK